MSAGPTKRSPNNEASPNSGDDIGRTQSDMKDPGAEHSLVLDDLIRNGHALTGTFVDLAIAAADDEELFCRYGRLVARLADVTRSLVTAYDRHEVAVARRRQ